MPSPSPRRPTRRRVAAAAALVLVAPALLATSVTSPAHARSRTPFIVVGTSDVKDSFLISNVIEPDFETAYPNIDLQYTGKATSDAITIAEAGGAAAIIVHAASLENQFVAGGYSAEPAGRALTYGDFVLAGRASDSAGVLPTGASLSHDMVDAYEKVALAGAAGRAEFVSRGGGAGTTVSEHAIWALTTGVPTCVLSAADGGGAMPSTNTNADGTCATSVTTPSWYHITNATQAANITQADACNGYASTSCYVYTDRGTFNYLQGTTPPGIANLVILARDNDASAPGGMNLLINSFHAYAVNPAAFPNNPGKTDLPTATEFLNFITSPYEQQRINSYLTGPTGGDVPFHSSAAPILTVVPPATQVAAGSAVTISGTVANAVPGTPALDGVPVTLLAVLKSSPSATPVRIATTTTGSTGGFQISYVPKASMTYTVATDQILKTERPDLNPVFKDILQPTSTVAGTSDLLSAVTITRANRLGAKLRSLRVQGGLTPAVVGATGKLALYLAPAGSEAFTQKGVQPLTKGVATYSKTFDLSTLKAGTYRYQVRYLNTPYQVVGTSRTLIVKLS